MRKRDIGTLAASKKEKAKRHMIVYPFLVMVLIVGLGEWISALCKGCKSTSSSCDIKFYLNVVFM